MHSFFASPPLTMHSLFLWVQIVPRIFRWKRKLKKKLSSSKKRRRRRWKAKQLSPVAILILNCCCFKTEIEKEKTSTKKSERDKKNLLKDQIPKQTKKRKDSKKRRKKSEELHMGSTTRTYNCGYVSVSSCGEECGWNSYKQTRFWEVLTEKKRKRMKSRGDEVQGTARAGKITLASDFADLVIILGTESQNFKI